jgi:hypothetical protein
VAGASAVEPDIARQSSFVRQSFVRQSFVRQSFVRQSFVRQSHAGGAEGAVN